MSLYQRLLIALGAIALTLGVGLAPAAANEGPPVPSPIQHQIIPPVDDRVEVSQEDLKPVGSGNTEAEALKAAAKKQGKQGTHTEGSAFAQTVALNDLDIRHSVNSVQSLLYVCKDWGTEACASSSVRVNIERGKCTCDPWPNWADADGFHMPAGKNAVVSGGPFPTLLLMASGWQKLSGCGGCDRVVTYVWE